MWDFRYLDQYGKKCWINGQEKQSAMTDQPFMVMGCLSRRVLAEKIDMLTGLRNYNKMLEDMGKILPGGRRGTSDGTGIDGFRDVNQRMGRSYGNKVLKQIAEILDRMRGEDETIYRLDGDHFAVDLMGRSRKETEGFFQQIQDRMDFLCTFSAGVVCYLLKRRQILIF
ncbi:MAG: diguanylate cyclase domain-containing protein [Blautia wexlerae]